MKSINKISIIVPIYNAEKYLDAFFKSYLGQTYLNDNVELVLVDNGSIDNSKIIIDRYISENKSLDIKYFHFDSVSDSYAARNFGVNNSVGEIIVFTDSDCILEPNWIENIINKSNKSKVISGEVEIQVLDKHNIWEVFDSFAHLNNKENAPKGKVATANLIVTRVDFLRVGYFEERFSGGDHDWSLRAKKNGLEILYDESIKVLHPSRDSFFQILNKSKRMAFGAGINHLRKKKGLISLVSLYVVKALNIKTNIRYSKEFKKRGFTCLQILKFNYYFMMMRMAQLSSAIKGFKNMNARKLNIQ